MTVIMANPTLRDQLKPYLRHRDECAVEAWANTSVGGFVGYGPRPECTCGLQVKLDLLVAAERAQAHLREELETERLRLAACTTAALGNTRARQSERIAPGHPYWSASYGDVCAAVDREIEARECAEAADASVVQLRKATALRARQVAIDDVLAIMQVEHDMTGTTYTAGVLARLLHAIRQLRPADVEVVASVDRGAGDEELDAALERAARTGALAEMLANEPCEICGKVPENTDALAMVCAKCGRSGYGCCVGINGEIQECLLCEGNE